MDPSADSESFVPSSEPHVRITPSFGFEQSVWQDVPRDEDESGGSSALIVFYSFRVITSSLVQSIIYVVCECYTLYPSTIPPSLRKATKNPPLERTASQDQSARNSPSSTQRTDLNYVWPQSCLADYYRIQLCVVTALYREHWALCKLHNTCVAVYWVMNWKDRKSVV
jgi:hypothetical protein